MRKISLLVIIIVVFSQIVFGAEEGAETFFINDDFPLGTIISQLVNFSILIAILFFTQRKKVSAYFAEKKQEFVSQVESAANSKKEAEAKLIEVQKRVEKLESTFTQQIEDAKKHADESYRTQLADAKNEAIRLKNLTHSSLEFEMQREIEKLRIEAYEQSAKLAEKDIESKMTPEQQKAWNSHFVQNVEGAH